MGLREHFWYAEEKNLEAIEKKMFNECSSVVQPLNDWAQKTLTVRLHGEWSTTLEQMQSEFAPAWTTSLQQIGFRLVEFNHDNADGITKIYQAGQAEQQTLTNDQAADPEKLKKAASELRSQLTELDYARSQ